MMEEYTARWRNTQRGRRIHSPTKKFIAWRRNTLQGGEICSTIEEYTARQRNTQHGGGRHSPTEKYAARRRYSTKKQNIFNAK